MNDNISMQRQKYGGYIQLLPAETYLQISNVSQSIFLNNNLTAYVVDSCGAILKTFTVGLNFQYKEYFNIYSQKNNVIFEFFINEDFGRQLLLLKFVNNTTSDIWYSAPFQCTTTLQSETSFFQYKNETYLKGVDYNAQNYFQSIRLTCFKNDIAEDVQNEEYTQLSGTKQYARSVITNIDKYKFYMADWFTFKRLSFILNHSIIYINNLRSLSSPGKITKGDRIEDSNLINLDFEANPTEETKSYVPQLNTDLQVVSLNIPDDTIVPYGTVISNTFSVTFNKNIQILDNSIKFNLLKEGVLVESKTPTVNLNVLSATFAHVFSDGNYFILVDPSKVGANSFGGNQVWLGFNDAANWNFKLLSQASTITLLTIGIKWADNTTAGKTGNEDSKLIYLDYLNTNNPPDIVTSKVWQLKTTGGFDDVIADNYGNNLYNLVSGDNQMRLKVTVQSGAVFYSNILDYVKAVVPSYPTTDYWFKAFHPDGHSGTDYINYLDGMGQQQTQTFVRSTYDGDGVYIPAPCTKITASSIIDKVGVTACKILSIICKSYTVSSNTSFTEPSIVGTYIDCNGINKSIVITGSSVTFCANEGSVNTTAQNLTITLNGDCQI